MKNIIWGIIIALSVSAFVNTPGRTAFAQTAPIAHQVTLPSGQSWCSDSMILSLFNEINTYRVQNGAATLAMSTLGMQDAEMRASQFATYMMTNSSSSPGFNPHQGYDTTAAGIGYSLYSEDLAYSTSDVMYIVTSGWQDYYHLIALLSTTPNVMGVSCVYEGGSPFWTYEPGMCTGSSCSTGNPGTGGTGTTGNGGTPSMDSEEWSFITLLNAYRAQNGLQPVQADLILENASKWMSNDLGTHAYVSHTDSLGRDTGSRLAAFGYQSGWGEDIEGGIDGAQAVLNGFQTACDPDANNNCTYAHNRILLGSSYRAIGVARAYGGGYGVYWTVDFGTALDQAISAPGSGAPTIASFAATPSSVASGQPTTLTWSVNGASSIVIDNGIGDVTTLQSRVVSPTQATTYTLTATNSGGTSTAKTTVTVSAAPDIQPPSPPSLSSATAKSSGEVDLVWTASTDNIGVAGYQIVRNNGVLTNLSGAGLSFADTTVSANTTYSYAVRAYDAAGNLSNAGNNIQVTVPGAGLLPPVITSFTATPNTVTAGQSASLAWAVAGATSLSIDNAVGSVSNLSSTTVAPAQTTTYTLTAANGAGSSTARVTLTVTPAGQPGPITHQISLPGDQTWCSDTMINGLFSQINTFRAQNGVPALSMSTLGMKDAEMRASQFAAYMLTPGTNPNSPSFNPHQGYDTTAAGLGYSLYSEDLAYVTTDPGYIVTSLWQDSLHLNALITPSANVMGVSCVYDSGWAYWTYEPGTCTGSGCGTSTPPPTSAPTISSFGANPNSVTAGQSATLSWSATGATSISIDNGVGTVTGLSSKAVSPPQTTTYTLTATNSAGNITARVTVTVTPAADTQVPSTPTLSSATAKNSGEVDLIWTAATDNVGVTGYQVLRNNVVLTSPSGSTLSFADTTVAAGATYTYAIRAFDAAGNLSVAGNAIQVAVPPAPAVPAIASFASTPASIVAGQSTNLSWSVTGATSMSIDNSIGTVTGLSSKQVSPTQNITYTLTATNSTGSSTSRATVTVTAAADTQPPSSPVLTSAIAKSSTEVDLTWTSSTDNIGVASYQVLRNGSPLTSASNSTLSFADTTCSASSTYTYSVRAFDAAGNGSTVSNTIQVTAPGSATTAGTAAFVKMDATTLGSWKGVYGSDGYTVVNDATQYPAYVTATVTGNAAYTWVNSTTDVRALQRANSATDRTAATWYSGTTMSVDLNFSDSASHQVAFYMMDWDLCWGGRLQQVDVLSGTGVLLDTRSVSNFRSGEYLVWNLTGHVVIRFTNTYAMANAVLEGIFFGPGASTGPVTPPPPTGTAAFVKLDAATAGNWKAAYGVDGYNVINDTTNYPSYVAVTPSGNSPVTWATSTTDPRALQKANSTTDRIAAGWYSSTAMSIDLNFAGTSSHQVALYMMDWDGFQGGRSQRVDILDGNGTQLDTQTVAGFRAGEYLLWNLSGHVVIRITSTNPSSNAVLEGLFFGVGGIPIITTPPPPTTAANSATFIKTDTATSGSWKGAYGADGYTIAGDATQYPSYVTVTPAGTSAYTWVNSTTDTRGLQKANSGTDRIASTWYSGTTMTVDLNFSDTAAHQVALYMMDWDLCWGGRIQQVDILDASGAVLDTRSVSNFRAGEYLVWNLTGHVIIRITNNYAMANAVMEGLFFR